MTNKPDEIIEHHTCFCQECGQVVSSMPFELHGKRLVIDIPKIKQIAAEHRVCCFKCTCGHNVESDFPVGDSTVKYGKSIETRVGYIGVRQYLPFKNLRKCSMTSFPFRLVKGICIVY